LDVPFDDFGRPILCVGATGSAIAAKPRAADDDAHDFNRENTKARRHRIAMH